MMKKKLYLLTISMLLLPWLSWATEPATEPSANWDDINYSLGHQIGSDLKRQGMDINPSILSRGVQDAFTGNAPIIPPAQMQELLTTVKQKLMQEKRAEIAARRQEMQALKEKYKEEEQQFFAENAKKEGVVSLPSGLQYKVITRGSGRIPGPVDNVLAWLRGSKLDGIELFSTFSEKDPKPFRVDDVIPGVTEALTLMPEGSRWQLFVPSDLAYKERGKLAGRALIIDVELLSIVAGK